MADPLSIAASIAGLLTLGVQVSTGLAQIISDARAADSLLTELTTDILILGEVFAQVGAVSAWRETTSNHSLPTTLERCHGSLMELQAIIVILETSLAKGGLQKRLLQATWSSKQKQIAAISSKISTHKCTLQLTLQMQTAQDMRDLKAFIQNHLESKTLRLERNERRCESVGRSMRSSASLYHDRPASSPSGSMWASSGSSFRTGSLFRNGSSFRTCRDAPDSEGSDDGTLHGSGNSEDGFSAGSSSSSLTLVPTTSMESIEIPLSLLGADPMAAEQMWAELAPTLPTASPAPYRTFKERYLSIYPYLWLHGRLWHGNRATYGTLLVTKYSTQSGKIEFSRVQLNGADHDIRQMKLLGVMLFPPPNGSMHESWVAKPTISVEPAMFGLVIENDSTDHNDRRPYSFHRIVPMPVAPESSSSKSSYWPPMTFEAKDRTTVPPSQHAPGGEHPTYSLNLFALRKTHTGLYSVTRTPVEIFSALHPKLYTPDIEHPIRGIWYWRARAGYEFVLFHQRGRNHLESVKLTGNPFVPRGFKSFEFEELQEGVQNGQIQTINGMTGLSMEQKCAIDWSSPDHIILRRGTRYPYHFRRLNIEQLLSLEMTTNS